MADMEILTSEVSKLIEEGKEKGILTYDALSRVLPEGLTSPEMLDGVLRMIDDLGIEMVEAVADREGEPGEVEEQEVKRDSGAQPIDDHTRLDLSQMGKIPLLSREDEIRLASRIEIPNRWRPACKAVAIRR